MISSIIDNVTGNEFNMARVKLDDMCLNGTSTTSPACDRTAQGISLSTPIVMSSFGILGNILALIVLYSSRREAHARRTVFFVMLSGLAWTDLLGLFAVSPIAIITYANGLRWMGGAHLCRYHGFMMVSFGFVLPLIVCCMSVERFLAIQFSYFYARHVTRRKAQLTFLTCLCVTTLFAALPFVGFGSYEIQFPNTWCFLNFHKESQIDAIYAAMFSSLNIIAILTMIVCNLMVSVTLVRMRQSRQLHSSPSIDKRLSISGVGSTTSGAVIRPRHHSDMEAQMIWFLGLITIAFSVCWLPLNVHILIMQFTGTTNRSLDLVFIRMVSCNQILDPWLYVIFRKNSLLRIIRQVKACCTGKKEPPKNYPLRPPGLRYVMGNKSFTCEATIVGKTFMTDQRNNNSPRVYRHLIKKINRDARQDNCNNSSESVGQLMSACSYCDGESFSPSSSNQLPYLTPEASLAISHIKGITYDSFEYDHNSDLHQHGNGPIKIDSSSLVNTVHFKPQSEPEVQHTNDIQKTILSDLVISANELNNSYYYSLDSAKQRPCSSSENIHAQINSPTQVSPIREAPFVGSLMNSSSASELSIHLPKSRPQSLKISLDETLQHLSPPLASPELLSETNSRAQTPSLSEKHAGTETSPQTKTTRNCITDIFNADSGKDTCSNSANIPSKNRDDDIFKKSNGFISSNNKNPHQTENNNQTCDLFPYSKDNTKSHNMDPITNNHISNGDDNCFSNHSPTTGSLQVIATKNSNSLLHKSKSSNCASPEFLQESRCLMSTKNSSSPLKTKPFTFPGKLFHQTFSTYINKSHKNSVSEAKASYSGCHLQNTDHTDHIKCFKAKKAPHLVKNGSVGHQKGLDRQINGCEKGML